MNPRPISSRCRITPVPSNLQRPLLDESGKPLDRSGPMPAAEPESAIDRLAIHSEFTRNLLRAFAALFSRHHLPHQIRP